MSASIQPDIDNIDNIAASEAVSHHLLSLQQHPARQTGGCRASSFRLELFVKFYLTFDSNFEQRLALSISAVWQFAASSPSLVYRARTAEERRHLTQNIN